MRVNLLGMHLKDCRLAMQQTLLPNDKDYWKHIVVSNNQFGVNILKNLAMASPTDNVVISPTSIFLTACLLYNGACGNTHAQMAQAMALPKPSEINPWNRQLLNYLVMDKPDHDVSIASALWFGNGVRCHEDFVNNAVESYSASLYGVDFGSAEAVEQINYWASNATRGHIENVVSASDFMPNTRFAISNAIYFSAKWQQAFDAAKTADAPFYMVGGGSKSVRMMSATGNFAYSEDDNAQMIKLPYKQSPYYMQIVLPRPGRSFGHCIEYIKNPNIVMAQSMSHKVDLHMPKISIEFGTGLQSCFAQLGITDLFNDACDLSLITPELKVNLIKHLSKLVVDEQGTVAAAVTMAGGWGGAAMPEAPPKDMNVNRPFLMAIADSGTGQVLFSGAVLSP